MISRRQSVERLSLLLGGALSPQLTAGLHGQVLNDGPSVETTEAQIALLAEVADVILPPTETPGAKEAGAHEFIVRVIRDCHPLEEQEAFYTSLARIDTAAREKHGSPFVDLEREQQNALVARAASDEKAFFRQLKQLTVTGYFTSEIGATEALEYLPVPGKFEGDVPMKPGQKAWAISR